MNELVVITALLIGLSLGIFGSGGAILTLPTLMYLLNYDEKSAIIGSLFVVAIISFFSAIPHIYKRHVSSIHLIYFAIPGLLGSYWGAYLGSAVTSNIQILVFVIFLSLAAVKMLTLKANNNANVANRYILAGVGCFVGVVTGFVGVGGGFLIVPALIVLAKLPINNAIATSVVIILLQSCIGLISYHEHSMTLFSTLQWSTLSVIGLIGVVGAYVGIWLKRFLNQLILTKLFGYFLILVGGFIFIDKILV